jgi:hypothetical protein
MKNGDLPEKRKNFKKREGGQRWEKKAVFFITNTISGFHIVKQTLEDLYKGESIFNTLSSRLVFIYPAFFVYFRRKLCSLFTQKVNPSARFIVSLSSLTGARFTSFPIPAIDFGSGGIKSIKVWVDNGAIIIYF